jgi:hypothetical protein
MSTYTFDIKTAQDFLVKKVIPDYQDFKKNPLSARKALNSAMSSFHLIDWILNDNTLGHSYTDISTLRTDLFIKCNSLVIMHDIANGAKHLALSRPKADIKDTHLHKGGFSRGFSFGFNVSALKIELNDGSKLLYDIELEIVIQFWKDYFKNEFNINVF